MSDYDRGREFARRLLRRGQDKRVRVLNILRIFGQEFLIGFMDVIN